MNQPIAGVTPAELAEVTCKVVWPTIGATRAGRLVGQLAACNAGIVPPRLKATDGGLLRCWLEFFTLGKLMALATIPVSLAVFCWQLMPYVCRRYALTNRRIIVRKGLLPMDQRWLELDEFETIDVEVLPGQAWLHAGDLIFRQGSNEVLRLRGVSRPEIFRHVCLTARSALLGVRSTARPEPAGM